MVVRIDFYRAEDDVDKNVVGSATWDGREVTVRAEDPELREGLEHVFRGTPIVVHDPSLLPAGASGDVTLTPHSAAWFLAVARLRAAHELDLVARAVPEALEGGYDPASNYRTFEEQVERLSYPSRP